MSDSVTDATLPWRPPGEIVNDFLDSAPIDLEQIAAALGIDVEREWFDEAEIAGRIERAPSGFRITINALDPPRRQRFTLAHEIAHYVLHRDLIGKGIEDRGLYRSKLGGTIERQANRYAASILMPAPLVRRVWAETNDASEIARRFNVSVDATRIRLKELQLVG